MVNKGSTMNGPREWWERPGVLALFVLVSIIPLLWPTVPPLVDLPGHMGRYAVELDPQSPILSQWYSFHWTLIGNMGVDLLILPMGKIFGLELGAKLIVIAIVTMTVTGLLWIAAEVHGRIPPTAIFALPLAYGHPFMFGFVNFVLGAALALLAFALWLRITKQGRLRLRPWLFALIACVIWVCHTFAWGLLGVLCLSAELVRQHDNGRSWPLAIFHTGLACLPMAVPLVPMVIWQSHTTAATGAWFEWPYKARYLLATLRDRWQGFDVSMLGILFALILAPILHARLGYSRMLMTSTLVLLAVFFLLPRVIFGSAYADMRLTPFIFAFAVLAIRPHADLSRRMLQGLAIAGLCFFAVRTTATTISLGMSSSRWDRALVALDHVPRGSRVAAFTGWTCTFDWPSERLEHIAAFAIMRRQAFSNDQWQVSGTSFMTVTKDDAPGFVADPSQLVTDRQCRGGEWLPVNTALAKLPRAAFDYVWLVDPPRYDVRLTAGMTPVWSNGTDRLYRINR